MRFGLGFIPSVSADPYPYVNTETHEIVKECDTRPNDTLIGLIDTLISAMKGIDAGSGLSLWDRLDVFYCTFLHTEASSRINWKDPAQHTLTGGSNFASNVGFDDTSVLVSPFVPSSGSNFTQDNALVGVYIDEEWPSNTTLFTQVSGTARCHLARSGTGKLFRCNSETNSSPSEHLGHGVGTHMVHTVRRGNSSNQVNTGIARLTWSTDAIYSQTSVGMPTVATSFWGKSRFIFFGADTAFANQAAATSFRNALNEFELALKGGYVFTNALADEFCCSHHAPANDTRRALIDSIYSDLISTGINMWTPTAHFYILAAHHESAARRNWKSPFISYLTGGTSFTVDQGFSSGSIVIPNHQNGTQNNSLIGFYESGTLANGTHFQCVNGSVVSELIRGSGNKTFRHNSGTQTATAESGAGGTGGPLVHFTRRAAAGTQTVGGSNATTTSEVNGSVNATGNTFNQSVTFQNVSGKKALWTSQGTANQGILAFQRVKAWLDAI